MSATLTKREQKAFEKELCERSFKDFVRLAWPHIDTAPFSPNWHLDVLADHLQACYTPTPKEVEEGRVFPVLDGQEGDIKRLLINVCPGSGKSLLVNVLFPAWVWTRDPAKRILSTSHKEDLAIRDSVKTRRLVESAWYQGHWPIQLLSDQNAKAKFENSHYGSRECSAFASITGSRGNIVILDDPHSVDDAKSEAKRQTAVDTFLETIPSRVNQPAEDVRLVVMQRLHMDDVSGTILDRPALGYTHLCIPLEADGEDRPATKIGWKDTRPEGENMHGSRFTPEFIEAQKVSLGRQFIGQYQQRPVPKDDGYFSAEWFHRYKASELPKALNFYMTSDHAPGGASQNDWNVLRVWGVDENRNLWLVDSFRRKCLTNEVIGAVRGEDGKLRLAETGALPLIKKYEPLAWYPENDNTWVAIQSFVRAAMFETGTFVRIVPLATKGSGDKMGKAVSYQSMAANGLVHLPMGPIGDEALNEYATFPYGRHDDQVDADGAIARVIANAMPGFIPPAVVEKKRDPYDRDERVWEGSDAFW